MTDSWPDLMIVGMGNPLLSDDGVGHHAALALGSAFPGATVHTIPMVGMDLLDLIDGFKSLGIVDAVTTGKKPIGAVNRFPLPGPVLHGCSSHGPDLKSVISLGLSLNLNIPETTLLYGIEIGNAVAYGEELTAKTQECLHAVVGQIAADMRACLQRPGQIQSDAENPLTAV